MPRKPRFFLPGVPAPVVQRDNDRQPIFFADQDYRAYLGWPAEAIGRYGTAVHAYVLMTIHVHLLVTPETGASISRTMQYLGRRYVPYVNRAYGRSGTLWEGRFKGTAIDGAANLLACARYIGANPVRAGMVRRPGDYRWSSYRANALGEPSRPAPATHNRSKIGAGAVDMWITRCREFPHIPTAQQQQPFPSKFDGRPL